MKTINVEVNEIIQDSEGNQFKLVAVEKPASLLPQGRPRRTPNQILRQGLAADLFAGEGVMYQWVEKSKAAILPSGKVVIVYCPGWCVNEYYIASWSGSKFECEAHGDEIDVYVKQWALFMEAD